MSVFGLPASPVHSGRSGKLVIKVLTPLRVRVKLPACEPTAVQADKIGIKGPVARTGCLHRAGRPTRPIRCSQPEVHTGSACGTSRAAYHFGGGGGGGDTSAASRITHLKADAEARCEIRQSHRGSNTVEAFSAICVSLPAWVCAQYTVSSAV